MTIIIKKSGSYAASTGVFVKKGGVYAAVQGVFSKVGGLYRSASALTRNNGASRLLGTQAQNGLGLATSALYSSIFKVQAPGPAIGARIAFHNGSPGFSCKSYRVSIAPTDIGAVDTVNNAWSAQVNGTINNSLYNASSNPNGFRKGTWGGAAGSRRTGKSNAVLPSFAYNNQEDIVLSDRIDLPSTPIRARDRSNEEYYFIVRVAQDCVANVDGFQTMNGTILYQYMNQWISSSGADCLLLTAANGGNVNDAVNGPFALPANPPGMNLSNQTAGNQMSGQAPAMSIEWIYPAGVTPISFLLSGDSITESYNWNRWAIQRKNTNPLRPLHYYNLGGSTTRTESFLGNLYLTLQSMAKPDYVVFPILSPNNYSPSSDFTTAKADVEFARLQEMAQFVQGRGIKLIWWTPIIFGVNPTDPSDMSTAWFKLYNLAKAYAAANGITFMDINGDNRVVRATLAQNPLGWIANDSTHPSDPYGMAGHATIFGEYLTALGI